MKDKFLIKESELHKEEESHRAGLRLFALFIIVLLGIAGIFALLKIWIAVIMIVIPVIVGLFIWFYIGGAETQVWVSNEELLDNEETVEKLEETKEPMVVMKAKK